MNKCPVYQRLNETPLFAYYPNSALFGGRKLSATN